MKQIHTASIVLRVVDAYTRMPLTNAAVLCTNLKKAGVWNRDGYCLFSNLPLGIYTFKVKCEGFCEQTVTIEYLSFQKPQIQTIGLAYSRTYPNLRDVRHLLFLFQNAQGAISHAPVQLQLKNRVPLLRVLKQTQKGSETIALSGEEKYAFLQRKFCTEQGEPIVFIGITETKQYILSVPTKTQIKKGDTLYPVWNLTTDGDGAFILPIDRLLMSKKELDFQLNCGEIETEIKVVQDGEMVQYVPIKL